MEAPLTLLTYHRIHNVNCDIKPSVKTKCFISDHMFNEVTEQGLLEYKTAIFYPEDVLWFINKESLKEAYDYIKSNNINVRATL